MGACFKQQELGRLAGARAVAAVMRSQTSAGVVQLRLSAEALGAAPELPDDARRLAEGGAVDASEAELVITALNSLQAAARG